MDPWDRAPENQDSILYLELYLLTPIRLPLRSRNFIQLENVYDLFVEERVMENLMMPFVSNLPRIRFSSISR